MTKLRIRYLTTRAGKGNEVRYFWQPKTELQKLGWLTRRLQGDLPAVIAQAERLNAELDTWRSGGAPAPAAVQQKQLETIAPGSVDALIALYKSSPQYKKLGHKTRYDYNLHLSRISDWSGDAPAEKVSRKLAKAFMRSMEGKPSMAAAATRVARILFQYGVDEDWFPINPFTKPGIVGTPPRQQFWFMPELQAMMDAADRAGKSSIGTAILLAWYLGQREGDILNLSWTQYADGAFRIRQRKTGRWIEVPAHPLIVQRLAELKEQGHASTQIVVSESTGKPYGDDNFRHLFADLRDTAFTPVRAVEEAAGVVRLERDSLMFMDLRRTAVVNLAEAGCSEAEIAAITGHTLKSVHKILETYLPRTGAMAANAMDKRIAREQKTGVVLQLRQAKV